MPFEKKSSTSLVVEIDSGASLKEFGQLLLRRIWQEIDHQADVAARRRGVDDPLDGFAATAYRAALRVMAYNCTRTYASPASRKWPSLDVFVGPGKSFQVEVRSARVIMKPVQRLQELFGYTAELVSPFELPGSPVSKTPLTSMRQAHWPLRDDSEQEA